MVDEDPLTPLEYFKLFHKHQLNLVAFLPLYQVDEKLIELVNDAIRQDRAKRQGEPK